MAISSMTGFARESGVTGPHQWAWECKSVNGRGLDVRLRVPPGLDAVGEEARAGLAKALARGQLQLTLTTARAASAPRVRVNEVALNALLDSLSRVRLPDGVRPASLDGLLAVRGVVEVEDEGAEAGSDELAAALRAGAERMIAALVEARRREGAALLGIVSAQVDAIEALVRAAEDCPARRPEAVRARLEAQVAALLDGPSTLDPDRLHQEAVILAGRADIREELDRLRAHVAAARELLAAGGAVGRRLDFLAQEFGREANTLCAKAGDVTLSRIGLDLKAVIEQFREQIQNVE
jgi:uncharacterized protein (TIGR00255 family)